MTEPRLRIFSDLHFRDPRGVLHDLAHFEPLLGDAERVVFNGDSIDTQIPSMAVHAGELHDFAARSGRRIDWLTGNHDPDFSDQAELSLADDRVWITHGDVFFDAIAPWSHHAVELRRRLAEASAGLPADELARIETRLRLNRIISLALPESSALFEPGLSKRAYRLARALFPPRRLAAMLHTWATTPRTVATFVRAQRPRAQMVVLGHTHYPGVWRVPGSHGAAPLTVINTGSFTRPLGGLFVEMSGEQVRVVRIRRAGGDFQPGQTVAQFSLG